MTTSPSAPNDPEPLQRDPTQWKTGDEPMTAAQRSYLATLAEAAGEPAPTDLTKAEAAQRIEALRQKTGREPAPEAGATPSSTASAAPPLKAPDDWTTGDEPMTAAQRAYLHTLSRDAGEPFEEDLTKAQASQRIDDLRRKTGRTAAADTDLDSA